MMKEEGYNSTVKGPEVGFDSRSQSQDDIEEGNTGGFEESGMKRGLSRRHVNMIAMAGMIGTGLFLSSGNAIALAGPVGAFLGFLVMGFITVGVSWNIAELSAFLPLTGGFVRHATKFVQPAFGTAAGWNYWYLMAITAPAELSAAATLINFWDASINAAIWYTVFIVLILIINFAGVRIYGEVEVVFASMKILLIIGLIFAGIIVDLGGAPNHDRIGFRYWKNPGPFNTYLVDGNTGKFLAFWSTFISAAYSYANIQVVAMAGTETKNPRVLIPNAMKLTFLRVIIFYVVSLFVVGLLVPYNNASLGTGSGTAQASPFVIAFQLAGIKVLPSVINAVVCTSAFSCGSACVFMATRTLYGLAEEGQAPKIFLKTNRFGTPYMSTAASLIFTPLVYLSLGSNSSVVFGWLVNITSIAGLVEWVVIEATYLRFYYGLKRQGISRDRLPYKAPFQPYSAWIMLVMLVVIVLTSGFSVFFPGHWSPASFITYYIDIAIFIVLWAVGYVFFREKIVSTSEMDFSEFAIIDRERETIEEVKQAEKTWFAWIL